MSDETSSINPPPHASRSPLTPAEFERVVVRLGLTPQQARVVELLLQGRRDKQIAAGMSLKITTVRTYLSRLYAVLGVADRVELVLHICATGRENSQRNADDIVLNTSQTGHHK